MKREISCDSSSIIAKKYGFEAMRNGMYIGKVLKVEETDRKLRDRIIEVSNSVLRADGRGIRIIHYGEADAIALALKKGIKYLLVDEKNTRLLIEDIDLLRKAVERRIRKKIEIDESARKEMEKMLKGIRVIRSTELVAVAVKRGIIR